MSILQIILLACVICLCCWAGYKFAINKKNVKATLADMKDTIDETVDDVKEKINK